MVNENVVCELSTYGSQQRDALFGGRKKCGRTAVLAVLTFGDATALARDEGH